MNQMLTETTRREAFLALVEAQDQGDTVEGSRTQVAQRFGIEVAGIRDIEREGLTKKWPPL